MTEAAQYSLTVGFDITRTKVVLRASEPFQRDLASLAIRFSVGGQRSLLMAEVGLDDFLAGDRSAG